MDLQEEGKLSEGPESEGHALEMDWKVGYKLSKGHESEGQA